MATIFAFSVITTLTLYCVCVSLCVLERVWFVFECVCVWCWFCRVRVCVTERSICLSVFVWNRCSSCPQMPVRLWVDVYEVRSLPVSLVFYTTIQLHRSYCNSLHLRAAVRWLHLLSFRCSLGCDAFGNCMPICSVTWCVMLALFPIIWGLVWTEAYVSMQSVCDRPIALGFCMI